TYTTLFRSRTFRRVEVYGDAVVFPRADAGRDRHCAGYVQGRDGGSGSDLLLYGSCRAVVRRRGCAVFVRHALDGRADTERRGVVAGVVVGVSRGRARGQEQSGLRDEV